MRPRDGSKVVSKLLLRAGSTGTRDYARAAVRLVGCGLVIDHGEDDPCGFSYAIAGRVLCVMQGKIENVSYLWHKLEETSQRKGHGHARLASSAPAGGSVLHINEAELVAAMFEEMGSEMLPKMRGPFSIICYNSETGLIIAARDSSGKVPLYHMRTREHIRIFSNSVDFELPGVEVMEGEEIPPGCFIGGDRSRLIRFASRQQELRENTEKALQAAKRALWPKMVHEPTGMLVRNPSKEPKFSIAQKREGNGSQDPRDSHLPRPIEARPEDAVLPKDISPQEVVRPRRKRLSLPRIESGIQLKVEQLDPVESPPCVHCVSGETSSAPEPRRRRQGTLPKLDFQEGHPSASRVIGFRIPEDGTCREEE